MNRRIAVVQLQGVRGSNWTTPGNTPGTKSYLPPADPPLQPAATPINWTQNVAPWIAAISGVLTVMALVKRNNK